MLSINLHEVLYFMGMGTLGALFYVIINAKNWLDFTKFDYVKRLLLGPLTGFLYSVLYSEYNFPNTVMAVVAGYTGPHFIIGIINAFRQLRNKND